MWPSGRAFLTGGVARPSGVGARPFILCGGGGVGGGGSSSDLEVQRAILLDVRVVESLEVFELLAAKVERCCSFGIPYCTKISILTVPMLSLSQTSKLIVLRSIFT